MYELAQGNTHAPRRPDQNARILVVDNEAPNARLLEMILSDDGFGNVKSLLDSTRALEVYDDFRPDIVLLDLHMPRVDGFDVMEGLKPQISPHEFMPIIVLTADISPAVKRRALSSGASDFLTKPFDAAEVLLRVRNLLTTRASHVRIQNQSQLLDAMVRERTAELSEAIAQMQTAKIETLERLALAGEYRDDDTGQHTKRVGKNAACLAMEMQLGTERAEQLRRAAPLHDIGKIGISDLILLKPGKLTPEEFEIIKTHTTIGAAILSGSNSPLLQLAAEIAISHHERWDGSGYPANLAGEEIPLSGQIVSVCDVFDALTHERPYKKAWSVEDAMREILSQTGKQFDPALTKVVASLNGSGLRKD